MKKRVKNRRNNTPNGFNKPLIEYIKDDALQAKLTSISIDSGVSIDDLVREGMKSFIKRFNKPNGFIKPVSKN